MSRYTTRAWVEVMPQTWEPLQTDALQVQGEGPVDTGLLDADGRRIWRYPEPIGFPIAEATQAAGEEV